MVKLKHKIGKAIITGVAKAFNFNLSQFARLWDTGADLTDESASKATSPYKQVSLVFTCINAVIDGMSSVPLVLSDINEKIIESGPAYDLLFNNDKLSFERFVVESVGHYLLERNVFWVFTDENDLPVSGGAGLQVKNIVVVPGSQMHPVTSDGTDKGKLVGWEMWGISGNRIRLSLSEVHQWKGFNPYSRFHGFGAITAAANDINYDFASSLYNASSLANGAEPGAIITVPGSIDEEQANLLLDRFDSRHKGAARSKKTALVTNGGDVKSLTMSLADLEVAQITEITDKKICSAFGVPPGIAGLITEAQYSHGPAMRQFIFNTIIPLAQVFAGNITTGILNKFTATKVFGDNFPATDFSKSRFYSSSRRQPLRTNRFFRASLHKAAAVQKKAFAWFDFSQHPAVQEYQNEVAEKVLKGVQSGIKLNNLIEAHDLPYEQVPWGDHWWIGMGQVPAQFILEAGPEGITGPAYTPPPENEEEDFFTPSGQRQAAGDFSTADFSAVEKDIWTRWVNSWLPLEREYQNVIRILFVKWQRNLIEKLKKAIAEEQNNGVNPCESVSKISAKSADDIIGKVVLDLVKEKGKLKVINHVYFGKASELGIRQSLSEIGIKGDELKKLTQQIKTGSLVKGRLAISSTKLSGVVDVTQKMVTNHLLEGLKNGEDLNKLIARIQKDLGSNRARAQRIARTQTAGAVGTGRQAGMEGAGVELKSWVTAGDEDVRDAHKTAGKTYSAGIPVNQPYIVMNETLMFPADPAGSAANIVNCRCVSLARKAAGKLFDIAYYKNLQFYSYYDLVRDFAA